MKNYGISLLLSFSGRQTAQRGWGQIEMKVSMAGYKGNLDMARYKAENDQMCFLCFMSFCVFFSS